MFQFVYWLKAIAAVCITNSHYADIWPVSAMAFGGHIGNCLYFFLSGFCLYNIRDRFPKWFLKRILRIYPALWIVNIIDLLIGRISIGEIMGAVHCFLYPTWYHFIASMMLLYVEYYVIRWLQKKFRASVGWFMGLALVLFLGMYVFAFDKSWYHIDRVEEHWVRFMFFESMMLGLWFREHYDQIPGKIRKMDVMLLALTTMSVFAAKLIVSRMTWAGPIQLVHPLLMVVFIASVANTAIRLEKTGFFKRLPRMLNRAALFLSGLTLEIYLGQMSVLWKFAGYPFPIDFIIVTCLIVVYAWLLHKAAHWVQTSAERLLLDR